VSTKPGTSSMRRNEAVVSVRFATGLLLSRRVGFAVGSVGLAVGSADERIDGDEAHKQAWHSAMAVSQLLSRRLQPWSRHALPPPA